jgi:multiple sugar transport system ATP-binding protein
VQDTAKILGIQDLLERKPKELSGGQRQRVALGRAIIREPDAFLFDEPLSNLDAKLRVQMRTELKELHERIQSTMIYVTHDQVEAMTMGDRIVVMKDGIVQQIDSAMELYNRPINIFVAGFIGSPAMNFIPCRLHEEESSIFIDTGDFKIILSDSIVSKIRLTDEKELVFGLRPEHIYKKDPDHKSSNDRPTITAMVNVVEPLGKEIYLDLSTGQNKLKALLNAEIDVEPHRNIDLVLNMDKAHLFSKESGNAIF